MGRPSISNEGSRTVLLHGALIAASVIIWVTISLLATRSLRHKVAFQRKALVENEGRISLLLEENEELKRPRPVASDRTMWDD